MFNRKRYISYILYIVIILTLSGCGEREEKDMENSYDSTMLYTLELGGINIEITNIHIREVDESEEKEYTLNDYKSIEGFCDFLKGIGLEENDEGLKLEPKKYYYIKFNNRDALIVMNDKYKGKYYSYLTRNEEDKHVRIDLVSSENTLVKIQSFLNK